MGKCLKTIEEPIKIGSRVMVELEGGKRITITIGDHYKSSSDEVVISYLSPIGSALLGKNTGDVVAYSVKDKTSQAYVVEVAE